MTHRITTAVGRRATLHGTGAAALFGAASALLPRGAFAQAAGPETAKATLGYVALTDAAPLIVARERGLFAKYGMPGVEVVKQASWDAVRRNLATTGGPGATDGAHIMSTLAYMMHVGRAGPGRATRGRPCTSWRG